jgi:hypothetical protein
MDHDPTVDLDTAGISCDSGQTLTEYALVLLLVAVVLVGVLTLFGNGLVQYYLNNIIGPFPGT